MVIDQMTCLPKSSSCKQENCIVGKMSIVNIVDNNSSDGDVVYEITFENQRGSNVFSKSKFAAKSLLPTDFPNWSDEFGRFRLPKDSQECLPTWEWASDWILDMQGDVDEEGWQYSFVFRATSWSGSPNATHYVRRRKWVRMRRPVIVLANNAISSSTLQRSTSNSNVSPSLPPRVGGRNTDLPVASAATTTATKKPLEVMTMMERARLDRERLAILKSQLEEQPDRNAALELVTEKGVDIFEMMESEASKVLALRLMAPLMHEPLSIVQSLRFFSDRKTFYS